jgi:hypothetical protein
LLHTTPKGQLKGKISKNLFPSDVSTTSWSVLWTYRPVIYIRRRICVK